MIYPSLRRRKIRKKIKQETTATASSSNNETAAVTAIKIKTINKLNYKFLNELYNSYSATSSQPASHLHYPLYPYD